MNAKNLQIKRAMRFALLILLLNAMGMTNAMAQEYSCQPLFHVSNHEPTIEFDITKISVFDERVFFLYNLLNDGRFEVVNSENEGVFIISASDSFEDLNLEETFVSFREQNFRQFAEMDKYEASEIARVCKASLPENLIHSLMMDIYTMSRQNNFCVSAEPFCTEYGVYSISAGVNAGSGEAGPYYNCLYTQPNPAWYYMQIGDPGSITIHMYSTPALDIDFCCWGPFNDPFTPCPNGLTSDKVVSCCYCPDAVENCVIPSSAQTGEYYILVITNYSNSPCYISFSKTDGEGTTACGGIPITAMPSPIEGGTISGAGIFEAGETCTLTATANEGYDFVNWTKNGTVVSTSLVYNFAVSEPAMYVANFQLQNYTVAVTANPVNSGSVEGGGTYQYGQSCTVQAVENNGYSFVNWTENGIVVSTDSSYSFTVNSNRTLVANFTQTHTITVVANPSNGGTVTGGGIYNHGQFCMVIATSANGYTFSNWTENGSVVSTDANYTFIVNNNRTLVANFIVQAPNTYTVNVSPNPITGGIVTGGGSYQQGLQCTVTATANTGYSFLRWTENGNQVSTNSSYTFTVNSNRTLVAQFQVQSYTISASANPNNGGSVSGGGNYNYGQSCTLTATPNTGYNFVKWTKNGTQVSTSASYTFAVTASASYVAHFQTPSCAINLSANPSNGGSVSGGGNYSYGQPCTAQAIANTGYTFMNWTENGSVVSTNANYNFTVTGNRILVANFTYNNTGDHDYVDLGLPSGTLWATCNVGADTPEGCGDYFAWGEIQPKEYYSWGTYQHCNGSASTLTKYTGDDGLTTLLPEDDAATANWGNDWRMPSFEDWKELCQNTTEIWTTQNGVNGKLFTAPNGNSLFLPITGYRDGSNLIYTPPFYPNDSCGLYWLNSFDTVSPIRARYFCVTSHSYGPNTIIWSRHYGQAVRPVRSRLQTDVPIGAIDGKFTINENGNQVYFSQGNLQYQATTNTWRFAENQWDYVGDANSNIGPDNSGWIDLFGWGTSGFDHGAIAYQPWSTNGNYTDYYAYGDWHYNLYDQTGKADWGYNAIANGGNRENQWRTLTHLEWTYVLNFRATTSGIRFAKAKVNDVNGVILLPDDWDANYYGLNYPNASDVSFSSNIITTSQWSVLEQHGAVFLSAAGGRNGTSIHNAGNNGSYWSASYYNSYGANHIGFDDSSLHPSPNTSMNSTRQSGISVRLVSTMQNYGTYTINTTCSPAEGGTVTGAGTYNAGETCTLMATANSGFTFINWTENGSVVSTNANYTFIVTANRNLVANFIIGNNLVFNGDFELGNIGFSTDYIYENTGSCNHYYVGHDIAEMWSWDSPGYAVGDHTTGEGLFLMIDGASQPNSIAWEQTVTVTPNTDYVFSAWFLTNNIGQIKFEINNVSGPDMTTPESSWIWEQRSMTWNSGNSTEATIKIINRSASCAGHDYCIDDICFEPINEGNLLGVFSVSDNMQVYFSQGNLQYQASTNTWRFAEHQWDCLRFENTNISPTYDGWIDLFGWGTSGYNHGAICYQPWSSSTNSSDYYAYGSSTCNLYDQTGQADWGYNAISNGGNTLNQWRTLTSDEWSYLLFNRDTPSGIRFAKAKVNDVEGLVVLPNNWDSSIYGLQNANMVSATYTSNIIAENDWMSVFEPHGVLFLPAGSYRRGTSSIENSNKGYYWSSKRSSGWSAGYLEFNNIQDESIGLFVGDRGIEQGLSVRLARTIQYTINTTCLPTEGGTVTGAGSYVEGNTCTLTATANEGYAFINWMENDIIVSTNANYSFIVSGNRNLVAHFDLIGNHWTPESANYSETMTMNCIIQIDGVEQYSDMLEVGVFCGNECRGSAIASEFNLTHRYLVILNVFGENGHQLTFKLYDHSIGQELDLTSPVAVSFTENGYGTPIDPYILNFTSTKTITATVDPEGAGTVTGTGNYAIGASCTLTAIANSGYQFKNWTLNGIVVSSDISYQLTVTENETYVAHFQHCQNQNLPYGWSWWSTYIEQEGINGLEMLENSIGTAGIRIQGRTGNADQFEYQGTSYWYGTLNAIENEQMYKIRTNAACNVVIIGNEAQLADHPITINSGWNWIGFPSGQSISLDMAMSGFTPEANDVIKGRNGIATYVSYGNNHLWYGSLTTLEPGQGYMYKSNSSTAKTLTFQSGRSENADINFTNDNSFFTPNVADFSSNMLVTAVIEMDGQEVRSEDYELAAFVGNECRGSVKLMYVEPLDRYIAILLVFGEEEEEIHFVLTDGNDVVGSDNLLTYVVDGIEGTVTEPTILRFGTLGMNDSEQDIVNIFPNPSDGVFNIEGNGIRKIEVFDVYGQVIFSKEVENNSMQIDLNDKARGMYLLRVITNNGITTNQLIIK